MELIHQAHDDRVPRLLKAPTKDAVWTAGGLVVLLSLALGLACRDATEPAPSSTWAVLSAERWYTCGLSPGGEAFCWGGNSGGFRDDPPPPESLPPNSALPLRVPGEHRFIAITVGETPICAIDALAVAYCWGRNSAGSLGDGSYVAKRSPSTVLGGLRWRTLSAGVTHVCGITTNGTPYCWGNQFRGALGNGEMFGSSPEPAAVLGGLTFTTVTSGGASSCGLTSQGEAYCWGTNDYGKLGDGHPPAPFLESASPSRVVGDHRFASLAVGGSHVCGVASDGRGYCWGWNRYGQLGNATTTDSSSPVLVNGDLRWASLSSGLFHTCGLTVDGAAYCWGSNEEGQFGTGSTGTSSSPELIASAGTYVAITAGGRHTCGRTDSGTLFCWGDGDYGQLGDGVFADRLQPVQVGAYEDE